MYFVTTNKLPILIQFRIVLKTALIDMIVAFQVLKSQCCKVIQSMCSSLQIHTKILSSSFEVSSETSSFDLLDKRFSI